MGKKGLSHTTMFVIFALVLSVGAYFTMQAYINNTVSGTLFEKLYLSRDISLMINALHAGQGNAHYTYVPEFIAQEKFSIRFDKHKVLVSDKGTSNIIFYTYLEDINQGFMKKDINPNYRDKMVFSKSSEFLVNELYYDSVYCRKPTEGDKINLLSSKILIDAGPEHNVLTSLMQGFMKESIDFLPTNILITREMSSGGARINDFEIKAKVDEADIIASFRLGAYDEVKNFIKAYVNADSKKFEQSYNLACYVGYRMLQALGDEATSLSIIPINASALQYTKYSTILGTDKPAFVIELGNINNEKNIERLKNTDLGKVLYLAIKEYYS